MSEMSEVPAFIEERETLKRSPTVSRWELEIRRLVSGQRALELFQIGGAQEYVEVLLESSDDKALAINTFHEALRNVTQEWTVETLGYKSSAACMLDLIGAFTPTPGFGKVLTALQGSGHFGEAMIEDELYPSPPDLHFKALVVLKNYFPVPPPSEFQQLPFLSYVRVLREHLNDRKYVAYAGLRLIQLGVLELGSPEFSKTFSQSTDAFTEILSFLLSLKARQIQMAISPVYINSLRLAAHWEKRFAEALEMNGVSLVNTPDGPAVRLGDGRVLSLEMLWGEIELETRYMSQRHISETKAGLLKLERLMQPQP